MRYKIKYKLTEQGVLSRAVNWAKNKISPKKGPIDAFTGITDYADRLMIKSSQEIKKEIMAIANKKLVNSKLKLKDFETKLNSLISDAAGNINQDQLKNLLDLIDIKETNKERKQIDFIIQNYIEKNGGEVEITQEPKQAEFDYGPNQLNLLSYDASKDKSRTASSPSQPEIKPKPVVSAPATTASSTQIRKINKPKNPFVAANPLKAKPTKNRGIKSSQRQLEESFEILEIEDLLSDD